MKEYLCIVAFPLGDSHMWVQWLRSMSAAHIRIEKMGPASRLWFPIDQPEWIEKCNIAQIDGILTWKRHWIEQEYDSVDVEQAPLFRLSHVGPQMHKFANLRRQVLGLHHFARVETSLACLTCGAGANLTGETWFDIKGLCATSDFANESIGGYHLFFATANLAASLSCEIGSNIQSHKVKVRGDSDTQPEWVLLGADQALTEDCIRPVRYHKVRCPHCGACRLGQAAEQPFGAYFQARRGVADLRNVPPTVTSPYWGGQLSVNADGSVVSIPSRDLWVRGDLGRVLHARRIRGLSVIPVLYEL